MPPSAAESTNSRGDFQTRMAMVPDSTRGDREGAEKGGVVPLRAGRELSVTSYQLTVPINFVGIVDWRYQQGYVVFAPEPID